MNRPLVSAFIVAVASAGCGGPNHIQPHAARHRTYVAGAYAQRDPSAQPTVGSIFSEAHPGFLEDTRAVRVGDFVVIRIDERADAEGGTSTKLNRESSSTTGATALLGFLPALKAAYPDMAPEKLLEFASRSGFAGDGNTSRKGQLAGSIAVRIAREMPNKDLYVEGTKLVLINNEEYHLYVSGLMRRADIAPDNTILSSRIADAQIEFTGSGDLADQNRKGWLARVFDSINPF